MFPCYADLLPILGPAVPIATIIVGDWAILQA